MRKVDSLYALGLGSVLMVVIGFQLTPLGITLNTQSPFMMGFFKFALIAIQGDFLAQRFKEGHWRVHGMVLKMVVWGLIGLSLVAVFPFFEQGTRGVFIRFDWPISTWVIALLTSVAMNLWFAPMMMAVHRLSDAWIDGLVLGPRKSIKSLIESFDWPMFLQFTLGKTIPFFWIPAHTITFLLPTHWRVVYAALLGVSLGLFQGLLKRQR